MKKITSILNNSIKTLESWIIYTKWTEFLHIKNKKIDIFHLQKIIALRINIRNILQLKSQYDTNYINNNNIFLF